MTAILLYTARRIRWMTVVLITVKVTCAFVAPPQLLSSLRSPSLLICHELSSQDNDASDSSSCEEIITNLVEEGSLNKNELNSICLTRLQDLSTSDIKQALNEYVKQKEKRVAAGRDSIAHPSAYVMAIVKSLEQEQGNKTQKRPSISIKNNNVEKQNRSFDLKTKQPNKDPAVAKVGDAPAASQQETTKITITKTRISKRIVSHTIQGGGASPCRNTKPQSPSTSTMDMPQPQQLEPFSMETAQQFVSALAKLEQPISTLTGVGPKTAEAFARLNLHTIRSLLWYFPTSFVDRTKLCHDLSKVDTTSDQAVTLQVTVQKMYFTGKVFRISCSHDSNDTPLSIMYFCGSSKRAAAGYRRLFGPPGSKRVISGGTIQTSRTGHVEITHPDIVKPLEQAHLVTQIEPIYRLTQGLTQSRIKGTMDQALEIAKEALECVPEVLQPLTLESVGWPCLSEALYLAHCPQQRDHYQLGPKSPPRMRLAFEELCIQQAHLALTRWRNKSPTIPMDATDNNTPPVHCYSSWTDSPIVSTAVSLLPFKLTNAQKRCLQEAWQDSMPTNNNNKGRMARLLQGDVSSGKTVVAYLLALGCLEKGGGVAAFLAPTTILANQHARSLSEFVDTLNRHLPTASSHLLQKLHVRMLTGGVVGKDREDVLRELEHCASTEAYILVGTHALLADNVTERLGGLQPKNSYQRGLALAVVDEEQRFGVSQRSTLSQCSERTLYMTATPIPRTLALGGYSTAPLYVPTGSMDVSFLDTKPQGVKPVKTSLVRLDKLDEVIQGVKKHLSAGAKVFWILPRIGDDENDSLDNEGGPLDTEPVAASVVERYDALVEILGPGRVGMVHGRMSTFERQYELEAFGSPSGSVDVMVGTTVLEVGIDIPSVTILVVEGAERFGLSQLHQLRGRIGRSVTKKQSTGSALVNLARRSLDCHCVLLMMQVSSNAIKRLNVLRETDDGARVAMADLEQRGPGEIVGFQQSGLKNGRVVDISSHFQLVHPAALLGRSFIEKGASNAIKHVMETRENEKVGKNSLLKQLVSNSIHPMLDHASPISPGGFRLCAGLAFFGNWKTSLEENSALVALRTLSDYTSLKKNSFEGVDYLENLFDLMTRYGRASLDEKRDENERPVTSKVSQTMKPKRAQQDTPNGANNMLHTVQASNGVAKSRPRSLRRPQKDEFDESSWKEDTRLFDKTHDPKELVYLVIDTETTGLSSSSHVIQIAAKVLGSSDPEDEFSAYCCPPVPLDPKIEQLTGITDRFLRSGGVDENGVVTKGASPSFAQMYNDFCGYCHKIKGGKNICILAHNAPFDIRILNAEVKRLAATARNNGKSGMDVPLFSRDTGVVAAIDTLQVVKSREFWRDGTCSRPSSFALESVYTHVFGSPMVSAHNACGDVRGLERLLLSEELKGWEHVGRRIQKPIDVPSGVATNLIGRSQHRAP